MVKKKKKKEEKPTEDNLFFDAGDCAIIITELLINNLIAAHTKLGALSVDTTFCESK